VMYCGQADKKRQPQHIPGEQQNQPNSASATSLCLTPIGS
jgi:hypothetical protein